MADKIKFILDGKTVITEPGETIWQVAKRVGTEIPHLCYAPKPGYRADGNCRACMVEIEGERVLALGFHAAINGVAAKGIPDKPTALVKPIKTFLLVLSFSCIRPLCA